MPWIEFLSSVNVLDIDQTFITIGVTMQRPSGSPLDQGGIISSGLWGIASGVGYCNTSGATIGEAGGLGYDGSNGRFFLLSGHVEDANSLHLMLLRAQARVPSTSAVDHESRELREQGRQKFLLASKSSFNPVRHEAREKVPSLPVAEPTVAHARNRAWMHQV